MPAAPTSVVVGCVFQLYQGDLDLGRRALERLREEELGSGVLLEDLSYGAVAVAQRLEELTPDALVLVGAERRGRDPGTVERREVTPAPRTAAEAQAAVGDAVTGYVSIDLLVDVAQALRALPPRVTAIEVEPARVEPTDELSAEVERALEPTVELVREELRALRG